MFVLHDRTRRWICRVVFLAICAPATLATLSWAIWQRTPGHLEAVRAQIAGRLGVHASLAGISHPRPGAMVFRGLELADLETRQPLLVADRVHVAGHRGAWLLTASHVEIAHPRLAAVGAIVARNLKAWSHGSVQIAVGRVDLGGWMFERFRGRLEATPAGAQTLVRLHLPGTAADTPIQLWMQRNRQLSPPSTQLQLRVPDTPLACALFRPIVPELDQLGSAAHCRGDLWLTERPGGWEGAFAGALTGVDLGCLVGRRYPHQLRGTADLVIQQARFRSGRLEAAAGTLIAGPGLVSRSLCQAAVDCLRLTAVDLLVGSSDALPYRQIALAYAVDRDGLRLEGRCSGAPRGTVLTTGNGPLLAEPRDQPVPVAALVRTLVPRCDVLVPATAEAERLTRVLPLPGNGAARVARERTDTQR